MRRTRAHWGVRVRDTLSTYLPLLLMLLLALATWWLARHAPQPEAPKVEQAPRHDADYAMTGVLLQRFDAEGRLRLEVVGDQLRHFPDDDTIEVDNVRIRAFGREDRLTLASARRAVTGSKADEIRLEGGAQVHSDAAQPGQQDVDFASEFLHVFVDARRVRTHLPVTLRVGTSDVRAAGLEYTEEPQVLQLQGPLHAVLEPEPRLPARKVR
jgi:lipopolysaccharide export system protein LptC